MMILKIQRTYRVIIEGFCFQNWQNSSPINIFKVKLKSKNQEKIMNSFEDTAMRTHVDMLKAFEEECKKKTDLGKLHGVITFSI